MTKRPRRKFEAGFKKQLVVQIPIVFVSWSGRRGLPASFVFLLTHCAGPPQILRKSSMIFCPAFPAPEVAGNTGRIFASTFHSFSR